MLADYSETATQRRHELHERVQRLETLLNA